MELELLVPLSARAPAPLLVRLLVPLWKLSPTPEVDVPPMVRFPALSVRLLVPFRRTPVLVFDVPDSVRLPDVVSVALLLSWTPEPELLVPLSARLPEPLLLRELAVVNKKFHYSSCWSR